MFTYHHIYMYAHELLEIVLFVKWLNKYQRSVSVVLPTPWILIFVQNDTQARKHVIAQLFCNHKEESYPWQKNNPFSICILFQFKMLYIGDTFGKYQISCDLRPNIV